VETTTRLARRAFDNERYFFHSGIAGGGVGCGAFKSRGAGDSISSSDGFAGVVSESSFFDFESSNSNELALKKRCRYEKKYVA
jgi:hypothetical protein